jgi:hypothetical protein
VFVHPDVATPLWAGNRWGSDPSNRSDPLFDNSLQYWAALDVAADGTIAPLVWQDNFTLGVAPPSPSLALA